MKHVYILCAAALGLSLAACDEVQESNSTPQTYPQESPFYADNIAVTPDAAVLDLSALNAENKEAAVAKVDVTDAPEGYTVELTMQVAKTAEFTEAFEVPCKTDAEGNVSVSADELQDIYYTHITHDPAEATIQARYAAYAVKGSTRVRMGGDEYFYGPFGLTLKPFPAEKEIADGYTLEVSAAGDFSDVVSFAFAHSDASPYDDPTFSVTATDVQVGAKWRIVAATGAVYGPAGASDTEGDLLADEAAGTLAVSAPVLMNINMLTDTYDYKLAYTCMYTPGSSNGWNAAASQQLTTTDYVNYTGFVVVESGDGFKFNPDDDWKGHDVGVSADLNKETLEDGTIVYTGKADGGNNIKTDIAKGLFYAEFNYSTREFKLTYISTLGIIGGFNGWAESVALTPSDDLLTWTSPATDFPAECEWKVRANDAWTHSWGGSVNDLVYNAGNIVTAEAGKYTVTINLAAVPYTATVTKQ